MEKSELKVEIVGPKKITPEILANLIAFVYGKDFAVIVEAVPAEVPNDHKN